MTSVVGSGGRRLAKDKKTQPNKSSAVMTNSTITEANHNNHNSDKLKLDPKLQPTAEQIRIANLMNDKIDDNDLKYKIDQIIELTGSSRDDAVVALHDCDNDTAKAIDMILEGDSLVESEWRSTGKKKKPPKTTSGQTNDENSKPDINPNRESKIENKDSFKQSFNKSEKPNNRVGGRGGGPPRLQRAALANKGVRKPKEFNNFKNERIETEYQNNDIFSASAQHSFRTSMDPSGAPSRRGDRRGRGRGGPGRGSNRGAFTGTSGGRGSRTFQNRGLHSNDGFPNSIDTWSNSTADPSAKSMATTDCNTMTVGNWSDIAANEDWSEEDWEPSHMETKVFTPSTKISEKDEMIDVRDNLSSNITSSQPSNLSQFIGKPSTVDSSQTTMSSILSANISRNANVAGQTLLQQIQQSSSQPSNLNQYSLSAYTKQATESIKSLVGLTTSANYNSNNADLLSTNERDLDHSLANSQTSNLSNKASRMKVTRSSKIPESAVEMPSNDSIAALGVHFGTLEFGSDNTQFSLGNDNSVFQDAVSHVTKAKKPDSNSLSTNSLLNQTSDATYRPSTNSNINEGTNKVSASIIQNSVLGHQSLASDSLIDRNSKSSVGPYGQKVLDRTAKSTADYSSVSPQQNVSDITSTYKTTTYSSDPTYNSVTNYSTAPTSSYPYSSNSQSNTGYGNYSSNFSGSTINNHLNSSAQKLRDIDSNSQQKQYDVSNVMSTNTGGSLGLISNSTVTTNVLKNTLPATGKGVHSVPPGVAATPVLSTPYIVNNTLPIYPMGIPYDVQFQTTARDHNFATYATQDVKYGRGSETDVNPVSSSQTGGSQTHNQTFVNTFPPGYGFYFAPGVNMLPQSIYQTAGPIYPVAQPQNTGSAASAFAKANTNYGSHSYNSGYDSISGVAQTQDFVKQSYPQSAPQHSKGISGSNTSDLSGANSSIYGKTHSQMNKSYDKQGFQGTNPAFNLTAGAQSGNLSASPYGPQYVLPHSQTMSLHHSIQPDVSSGSGPGVTGQRSMSQTHKSSSGGSGKWLY